MALTQVRLDDLNFVSPSLINGEWVRPDGAGEVVDPALGRSVARVALAGAAECKAALSAAAAAWSGWRKISARQRGEFLQVIADGLERQAEEVATLITRENGKPLAQSRGEVAMSVAHLRWFAEEGPRAYGRVIPHQDAGKRSLVIRQPVGVVGAISPWNFPLLLAVRKVAPALAAGCPVILKPSEVTPLCCVALAECIVAAKVPAGVFQLLIGDAPAIVGEMMRNALCRKVSFTGSTRIGKVLIAEAAQTVKRLGLELGGNAPLIVFADAPLEKTVEAACIAKYRNTGQACNGANRFYVQRKIYPAFVEAFAAKVKSLAVGNGLQAGVEIGPVISAASRQRLGEMIAEAVGRGGRVVTGGKVVEGPGFFMEPAVLADVPEPARLIQEEIFGPVTPIAPFDEEAEVIAKANATPFGLAAYVYTSDLNRALRVSESLEAGMIGLNDSVPTVTHSPFGGMKESGWGRELGSEGLDAYLETKHISIGGVGAVG